MSDRFHDLLPLHVEGDLSPEESAEVRRHLTACEACRREEALLLESQAFWKGAPEPPLDETFHADVRRAVRLRIAQDAEARRRRSFLVWAGLATAAATLAAAFLVLERPRPLPDAPAVAAATEVPARSAPEPARVARPEPAPRPPGVPAPAAAALAEASPASRAPSRALRPALVRRERRPAGAARVTRIEMATPNPDVRIIWLANASDAAPI